MPSYSDDPHDLNHPLSQALQAVSGMEDALGAQPSDLGDPEVAMLLPSEQPQTGPRASSMPSDSPGGGGFLDAITPSADTLHRIFAGLEAAGAVGQGRTPLYLQQQQVNMQQQQMEQAQSMRREQIASQIAAHREQQRHNTWNEAIGLVTNKDLSYEQRVQGLKERGKDNPVFSLLANGLNAKRIGELESHMEFMPKDKEEYVNGLKDGSMNLEHIFADLDVAKETRAAVTKAQGPVAVMQNLQRLLKQNPNDPHIQGALATMQAEQAEKQSKARVQQATEPAQIAKPQLEVRAAQQNIQLNPWKLHEGPIDDKGTIGTFAVNLLTGEKKPIASGQPVQRMMSAGMQGQRAELTGSLKILQDTAHLFHPDFVGTYDTVKNAVSRMMGTGTERTRTDPKTGQSYPVKEEDFRVAYDMVQKELRKVLMGTAQSPTEISTNPLAFPQASDRDADITVPAFFRTQYRNLVSKLSAQDEIVDQHRRAAPMTKEARYHQLIQNAGATDPHGKNALGFKTPAEINQAIAERLAEEMQRGWITP